MLWLSFFFGVQFLSPFNFYFTLASDSLPLPETKGNKTGLKILQRGNGPLTVLYVMLTVHDSYQMDAKYHV